MINELYGRLTVLRKTDRPSYYECACSCGNLKVVRAGHLKSGATQSCGCIRGEVSRTRNVASAKHGMHSSPTYASWQSMRTRCLNERSDNFSRYGGRGIKICAEWDSFQAFMDDMGERPEGSTLDRIETDGDYTPSNCRWATMKVQENNKRNNVLVEHDGKTMTISQWADESGLPYHTIRARLRMGWPPSEALTMTPSRKRRSLR